MACKGGNGLYLKVVFSKIVKLLEPNDKAIAVDINENNVVFGSESNITNTRTGERVIRTTYFLNVESSNPTPDLMKNPCWQNTRVERKGGLMLSTTRSPTK